MFQTARVAREVCVSVPVSGTATRRSSDEGASGGCQPHAGKHPMLNKWPERVILATAAMNSRDKACYDSGMFAFDITLVILSRP